MADVEGVSNSVGVLVTLASDALGVELGDIDDVKLELRSKTDEEHEFKENIVALNTFIKLMVGIGNRPKAFANVSFFNIPATPRLLSVIIAAEK